jgi:hypothetical protein
MANKKQKRMEQDPKVGTRGKPKPRPGVKVNVDGINLGSWSDAFKVDAEKVEKIRAQMAKDLQERAAKFLQYDSVLFGGSGGSPKASGGGIHIEGSDGRARPAGSEFDPSGFMAQLLRMAEEGMMVGEEDAKEPEDQVATMLLSTAVQMWEHPLNWQFMVGHNPGQSTFWFTAKFYDDEAEDYLAEGTIEITEEAMLQRTLDESQLDIERQMAALQEKLTADLAAFEED